MEEGSVRLCFPFLSSAPVTDSVSLVGVSVSGLSLKRPFRDPPRRWDPLGGRVQFPSAPWQLAALGASRGRRRVRLLSARARIRLLSCGC